MEIPVNARAELEAYKADRRHGHEAVGTRQAPDWMIHLALAALDATHSQRLAALAEFARKVIVWDDLDRLQVLDLAERLGLTQTVVYDPALHGEVDEAEAGEEIWTLAPWLKAAARPPLKAPA